MTSAESILTAALERPVTLGSGRLIALDGPSGSGKSTIAAQIAELSEATVVHTDDLCPGWDGVPQLPRILAELLSPLVDGRTGRYPRYDWILGHLVEDVVVEPTALIVLEGVGAGSLSLAALTTALVWVDGETATRQARAFERDGDSFRDHWEEWARAEQAFFTANDVAGRADLSFSTT